MADIKKTNHLLRGKLVSVEGRLADLSKEIESLASSLPSSSSIVTSKSSRPPSTEVILTTEAKGSFQEMNGLQMTGTGAGTGTGLDSLLDYQMNLLKASNTRLLELLEMFAGMQNVPMHGMKNVSEWLMVMLLLLMVVLMMMMMLVNDDDDDNDENHTNNRLVFIDIGRRTIASSSRPSSRTINTLFS